MCDYLARSGHKLVVITAPTIRSGKSGPAILPGLIGGTGVWRAKFGGALPGIPRKQSGLMRILLQMSFGLSSSPLLFWKALFWRPQIVWTVIPATLGMPGSLVAAKLAGAKSWLHVQDLEVDAAFNLGLLASRRLHRWALRLEGALLRQFDVVSSITPSMLKRLAAKGVSSSRSALFPNWVDTDYIYPLPRQSVLRAEFGLEPGDFVALYSGNLGEKQEAQISSSRCGATLVQH